jgi:hypothetical protein
VAHRSLSKCGRSKKYKNHNSEMAEIKMIIILCHRISVCAVAVKSGACVIKNQHRINVEVLQDENSSHVAFGSAGGSYLF